MNTLGIFVKHPRAGMVKTRLARRLGGEDAAELYAAFIADLTDRFRAAADRRVLGYTPADESAERYFRAVAGNDYVLWKQLDASLGERIAAFLQEHLAAADDRVVLIGSDSPSIPRGYVDEAFELLATRDVVLGPATDGGYYLLGVRGACPRIFDRIDWSTAQVLQQTVDQVVERRAVLGLLPPWYDIDHEHDLYLLRGHIRAMQASGQQAGVPRTEALIERVLGALDNSGAGG